MSNFYLRKNKTVALSDIGEVLWYTSATYLGGAQLNTYAPDAVTIIIGDTITSTLGGAIFAYLSKVRKIYVYNENMYNLTNSYYTKRGMKNESNEDVTITLVEDQRILTPLFKEYYDNLFVNDGEIFYVSDFGAIGYIAGEDNVNNHDDIIAINKAIKYVVNHGGKLIFDKDKIYNISSPIEISPLPKSNDNPVVHNFEIDFNNSVISVLYESNNSKFGVTVGLPNTMVYVNCGYACEERLGVIKNLKLCPYGKDAMNVSQTVVETGMYLEASANVKYQNIEIKDVIRGVYIDEKPNVEIFMEDIIILKSPGNNQLSANDADDYKDNYHHNISPICNHVGIDCRGTDNHFSNISITDYLVGIRNFGQNNRYNNVQISNENCADIQDYTAGFVNLEHGYYIDCVVNNLHIGWMSYRAKPFFLTNCTWIVEDIETTPYRFYILPANYSGKGIYATNCIIVDNQDKLIQSNLDTSDQINNDINYY